jgi:hypothetical protein
MPFAVTVVTMTPRTTVSPVLAVLEADSPWQRSMSHQDLSPAALRIAWPERQFERQRVRFSLRAIRLRLSQQPDES